MSTQNGTYKRCLILEQETFRYQAALSDMSGSDIKAHRGSPQDLVRHVRDWLNQQARLRAPGPSQVWDGFNEFMAANYSRLKALGFSSRDIDQRPVDELLQDMHDTAFLYT